MHWNKTALLALIISGSCAVAQNQLRVGAARVDVTGAYGPSQTGKYDNEQVNVRAIVLDNGSAKGALISVEFGGSFEATVTAIQNEFHIPKENIIISSTHTHSGVREAPIPPLGPGVSPHMPPESTQPSQPILQAVREAMAKLQPARVGFGKGASYLNVNRDGIDPETRKWLQYSNLDAPSDKTVAVLTFEKPSGEPIAVYVNYAMHPINGYVLDIVSGDFPGAMSRYVEKAFSDKIVVAFTQGASGDQNPLYLRPSNDALASRVNNPITGFEISREKSEGPLRSFQYGVAEPNTPPAKDADPKVMDNMLRFIDSEGEVRLQGLEKDVSCPGRKRTNGNPWSATSREGQEGIYVDGPPRVYQIGVLGIGTTAVAWINGEIFTLIGEKTKRNAPLSNTMFSTISNDVIGGYTPDDTSYGHLTFQVLDSVVKPGCAESSIVRTVQELENEYLQLK